MTAVKKVELKIAFTRIDFVDLISSILGTRISEFGQDGIFY